MPNHVTTKIEFHGKQENINKIFELIKGYEECIDFNKLITMPKELNLPSSTDADLSMVYALEKMTYEDRSKTKKMLRDAPCSFYGNYYNRIFGHNRNAQSDFIEERAKDFERRIKTQDISFGDTDYENLGIKTFEDLGNAYIRNIIVYGHDTWYDWCCANWGTKWNAYHSNLDKYNNTIEFDTAWACPIPVLEQLATICDEYGVWFEGKWADEDAGSNTGTFESNYCGEGVWNVEYMENRSDAAYEIYTELKGTHDCLGKDDDGHWVFYDCDSCPHPCC